MVQSFIFTRFPPPGRRVRTPGGPAVHLQSLSTAVNAFPDRERSSCSSSLAIRRQEGVSGPRVVQPFIFTRHAPPGRSFRTVSGPAVHLHSLSAARKALPGPSGPAVHLHSPCTAGKEFPDRERSRRLSSLVIRRQEGVSGPRVVQPFIFTRHPPPGRRIRSASGPVVYLHSLSATGKACSDPGWSSRSSSLAIRRQEGVSGPRVVQPFIFTRHAPPGRSFRTVSGPAVHLHSLSTARKAFPDPEWSSRPSSLAMHRREGVSGP